MRLLLIGILTLLIALLLSITHCTNKMVSDELIVTTNCIEDFPLESEIELELAEATSKDIKWIVVHTTASQNGRCWTEEEFNALWEWRGFSRPGYHIIVQPKKSCGVLYQGPVNDCTIDFTERRWGAAGRDADGALWNSTSIHISWVGGIDGTDSRTKYQKETMKTIIEFLKQMCPNAKVIGHRDTGARKSCPNFDAASEY